MSTGPVVREELRKAIQLELVELLHESTQEEIARRIRLTQGAVSKAKRSGELGQDFAERFLRAFKLDENKLVAKHGTRTTAGDVVVALQKYPALRVTIESDTARWSANQLFSLVAKIKRNPPRSASDGSLIHGTWRDMLDRAEEPEEPNVVGGLKEFREQTKRQQPTPKGG